MRRFRCCFLPIGQSGFGCCLLVLVGVHGVSALLLPSIKVHRLSRRGGSVAVLVVVLVPFGGRVRSLVMPSSRGVSADVTRIPDVFARVVAVRDGSNRRRRVQGDLVCACGFAGDAEVGCRLLLAAVLLVVVAVAPVRAPAVVSVGAPTRDEVLLAPGLAVQRGLLGVA